MAEIRTSDPQHNMTMSKIEKYHALTHEATDIPLAPLLTHSHSLIPTPVCNNYKVYELSKHQNPKEIHFTSKL